MRTDEAAIAALRARVDCRAVLEHAGWRMDIRESTRRALKYRAGPGRIVIVTHAGHGWFDPLSTGKGDVFALARHLWGGSFRDACIALRPLAGITTAAPALRGLSPQTPLPVTQRWERRHPPRPGSPCWRYLTDVRGIPITTLERANAADILREGPAASLWALHRDTAGDIVGWEMRGPQWRGFATGGHKTLFIVGARARERLVVTEAAIDALSLATLEGLHPGSLYASTGGGIGPATERMIIALAGGERSVEIIAATDADGAGERHAARADRSHAAFVARFPRPDGNGLFDVVDVDHVAGRVDARIRPNQIFAAGGLPYRIVSGETARAVVATVERELVTPMGLRTLARGDPAYQPRCEGGVAERDGAYHQGTVWPWLMGGFVDAWLNVNGDDDVHRAEARRRFLAPLQQHLAVAGLGHVSEIADGDPPHMPRGCPFQAWSLGELMRVLARTQA